MEVKKFEVGKEYKIYTRKDNGDKHYLPQKAKLVSRKEYDGECDKAVFVVGAKPREYLIMSHIDLEAGGKEEVATHIYALTNPHTVERMPDGVIHAREEIK